MKARLISHQREMAGRFTEAAENLGLLFRRQFVIVILHQIVPVFLEPPRKPFPFLGGERED